MFGVSFLELVVIFSAVLIVFGPDKLPELARSLGKLMSQFRRTSDEVRREFYNSLYKPADELRRNVELGARNLISSEPNCEQVKKSQKEPASPGAESSIPAPSEERKDG